MKKITYIIFLCLIAVFLSCSQEEMIGTDNTEKSPRSITFSLSMENSDFSVQTRTQDPVNIGEYYVKMFLFKKDEAKNAYIFDKTEEITSALFSITGLVAEQYYAYVFVAVPRTDKAVLDNIKDYKTFLLSDFGDEVETSAQPISATSILTNCFIPFFEEDADFKYTQQTLTANRQLEVWGDGNYIPAGMEYHTPVNLVMRRHIGVVEVQLTNVKADDEITCSVQSDYYRLYLSQMIKDDVTGEYSAENSAVADETQDAYPTGGDYFSNIYGYINIGSPANKVLPKMTKTVKVSSAEIDADGNYNLQMYLPYTTARSINIVNVPEDECTNYSKFLDAHQGDGLTLKKGEKTYNYSGYFPIYRNAKTSFYIKGDKLSTTLGDGGIDLDDDQWDGIQ